MNFCVCTSASCGSAVEINATAPADDEKVPHTLWNDWNAGHHYYLSAGTDTHDVWRFAR
jgi:hypothetical protein